MSSQNFQTKLLSLQSNLLNFAYMLTSNRDDAYDLLQDTTLKALDNEDKYVDNVNFKGWVFTIMRNISITSIFRRNQGLTLPKALLLPVRFLPLSILSLMNTAYLSLCTLPAISTTKLPRR